MTSIELLQECIDDIICEIIRKSGNKYVLYSKHTKNGKRKKLGTHVSKASAKRQERAIHANKH